jgi:hypothetical protein
MYNCLCDGHGLDVVTPSSSCLFSSLHGLGDFEWDVNSLSVCVLVFLLRILYT